MKLSSLRSATALSLVMFMSNQVWAQQDDAVDDDGVLALEEIIVTAQRTSQSLQDVPVSVNALSGRELSERNINEVTQLALAAPTLQVGTNNTFAIRGIGSLIFTPTTDPSVAFSLDGVNLGRNGLANVVLTDIASVEVLNGPQGLLFGKNASAGLINMTTVKPVLGETSGSLSSELVLRDTTPPNAKGRVFRGTLNLPAGEKAAFRINASYSDQDSIIPNLYPETRRQDLDQERWGIKGKFLYENSSLSLYVIADHNESSGTAGRYSRTYRTLDPNSDLVPSFEADGIVPGPENLYNSFDGEHWHDEKTGGVQATISYELESGLLLENIAAWRYFDLGWVIANDFHSEPDILRNVSQEDYSQFSNEFRVVVPRNDSYAGQVGLYYFSSTNNIVESIDIQGPPPFIAVGFPFCVGAEAMPGPPPACNISNDFFLGSDSVTEFTANSIAAFGQFDFFLTDRLTATVGGRITRDKITSDVVQGQRDYFIFLAPRATIKDTIENTNFSWRLAAAYELSENSMIYASYGSGYKAPGYNTDFLDIPEVPFAVEAEVSKTLEIGYKSMHWDDRLVLNVSAFRTDFNNYQSQSFNLDAQGFIIQNAASVISQGAEISLTALLTEALTVSWDVALVDAKFDEYLAASCGPDSPCGPTDLFWDASGQPTPLASDVTSTLQAVYSREISDGVEGFLQGSMYYRSDMSFGVGSAARTLKDVTTYNLSIGVRTEGGWTASLFCKNCTDNKTPTGIDFDPGENNAGLVSVNQTWGLDSVRTIGLTLSKEF